MIGAVVQIYSISIQFFSNLFKFFPLNLLLWQAKQLLLNIFFIGAMVQDSIPDTQKFQTNKQTDRLVCANITLDVMPYDIPSLDDPQCH